MIVDECHITLPQVRAMYPGDRARKERLVENGFRLPSAYDNRPLNFDESKERLTRSYTCPRRRRCMSCPAPDRWLSRSSARPACSIQRWSCVRSRGRSTT